MEIIKQPQTLVEWGSVQTVINIFGIGRTSLFRLIKQKCIISKVLNINGNGEDNLKGKRLINIQSVRDYIDSQNN